MVAVAVTVTVTITAVVVVVAITLSTLRRGGYGGYLNYNLLSSMYSNYSWI
jgi:hypothetical protein